MGSLRAAPGVDRVQGVAGRESRIPAATHALGINHRALKRYIVVDRSVTYTDISEGIHPQNRAKLDNDVGAGRYMLRAQQAKGQYVVHVFEPGSDTVLRAGTDRDRALAGETLRLNVAMNAGSRALKPQAEALLVAPDGRTWPVALAASGNGLGAEVKLPAVASSRPQGSPPTTCASRAASACRGRRTTSPFAAMPSSAASTPKIRRASSPRRGR